jgi:hypothetical protein
MFDSQKEISSEKADNQMSSDKIVRQRKQLKKKI